MRYKLLCAVAGCGDSCWVRGEYEPDTNAVNIDGRAEFGDACEHIRNGGAYSIVDEEGDGDDD